MTTTSPMSLVVPLKDIHVLPNRARKHFGKIQELADSIKRVGLINPIYVTEHPEKPGKYALSAGERRFRAAILAGLSEVRISFQDKLSDLEKKIVELEENTHREDLDWQEEAELHRQIDELKRKQDPTWKLDKTAETVGLSKGYVSRQINMAKVLNERPELREKIKNLDFNSAAKVIENTEKVERADRLQKSGKLVITSDLKLGSCVDKIKELPDNSVDLCITDPPYGLEQLEDLRGSSGGTYQGHAIMSDDHNQDLDSVLTLLKSLAPELKRAMKPSAHLYVFTAFQYIGDFIKALAPFQFQPPVLIWRRVTKGDPENVRPTTMALGYNYMSAAECIIFFHNPPRGKRLAKNMSNILDCPGVSNNERLYPTEKPQDLLKILISQSSNLGDLVLDPFAGSASTLKAAKALGRKSLGFEVNEEAWKRAQLALAGITE